jgi:hypothetical protein
MRAAIAIVCASLAACAGGDGGTGADLPTGWENAERVDQLVQMECGGSPQGDYSEQATFVPGSGSLGVDYQDAPFRCEQDVEGFVLHGTGSLELLVQPIDMDPDEVAACDCLYHIEIDVLGLAAGELEVSLERRWDHLNEPNDPIPIAARTVTIE